MYIVKAPNDVEFVDRDVREIFGLELIGQWLTVGINLPHGYLRNFIINFINVNTTLNRYNSAY